MSCCDGRHRLICQTGRPCGCPGSDLWRYVRPDVAPA